MKKKSTKGLALLGAALVLVAGTFAFFTDRVTKNVDMDLGTLTLSELTLDANKEFNPGAPGDVYTFDLAVTNEGSLDADLRVTYEVTTTHADKDNYTLDLSGKEGDALLVKPGKVTQVIDDELAAGAKYTDLLSLTFDSGLTNDYQAADLKLTVVVEAKQSRNSGGTGTWTTLATDSINLTGGAHSVVPGAN